MRGDLLPEPPKLDEAPQGRFRLILNAFGEVFDLSNSDFAAVIILRLFSIITLILLLAILTIGSLQMFKGASDFFDLKLCPGSPPDFSIANVKPKGHGEGTEELSAIGNGNSHAQSSVAFQIWKLCYFEKAETKPHMAIATLMDGMEYFLLAPLAYLLLRTLAKYLASASESQDGNPTEDATTALISVKAFSTSLLIAVLATHLVSRFLEEEKTFPWIEIGAGALLLLVLVRFYDVISHHSKQH